MFTDTELLEIASCIALAIEDLEDRSETNDRARVKHAPRLKALNELHSKVHLMHASVAMDRTELPVALQEVCNA